MKKVMIVLALFAMTGIASANLLTNGDFETGDATGWFTWGANAATYNATTQPTLPLIDTTSATLWWSDAGFGQMLDASAGQTFTLSGKINVYEALAWRNAEIKIEFWDGDGTYGVDNCLAWAVDYADYQTTLNTWQDYSVTLTAPAGTTKVKALLVYSDWHATDMAGKAAFDNVSLVPEPATLALLGLGGLLIRRKK